MQEPVSSSTPFSAPVVSLPRDGSIRGLGELYKTNPATGTGSLTVPLPLSPARSGFGPQISLSYDSGSGAGPWGYGWSVSLPSITRRTDKGLPRYHDAEESDVFVLSGAEDLVPVLDGDKALEYADPDDRYVIRRYRPRIEGLFARIERWTSITDPADVAWRSISRDNVTTWYGRDDNSRIADPGAPERIFSWLICESYDDKGNAIVYRYKAEDSQGVDLTSARELNRKREPRSANRYLKRIRYGNRQSRLLHPTLPDPQWMFEVVIDYGEHDNLDPRPLDDEVADGAGNPAHPWFCRRDSTTSWRATFPVRCHRLVQRILSFHHFKDEPGVGDDCLVRATEIAYRSNRGVPVDASLGHPVASLIASITQAGFRRDPAGGYVRAELPPLEFEYSEAKQDDRLHTVDVASLENLPRGVDGAEYQWVDLDGEGVSGILAEQAGAWFYKANLSPRTPPPGKPRQVEFAPRQQIAPKPSAALAAGAQLVDLGGDGNLDVALLDGPGAGFFERTKDAGWKAFRAFLSRLNITTRDPALRLVDLDGDGHADVLQALGEGGLTWYRSLGEKGFGAPRRVAQPFGEDDGPALVFADGTQSIFVGDLNGDGVPDLIRVRWNEVSFWPGRGYCRFGPRVTMGGAPRFDTQEQFDPSRLRFLDADGSGCLDLAYLSPSGVDIYTNESGNAWRKPRRLPNFPAIDCSSSVSAADLFGNGTSCLVWSSPLSGNARRQMRYVDLCGGGPKPNLLMKVVNNLGAETLIEYASSTKFYVDDKLAGRPWRTRLPFPVQVVERVHVYDRISRSRYVTRYAYREGFFDGETQEFRGFGMVSQFDSEEFAALSGDGKFPDAENIEKASHLPPVETRTWFHTGAYFDDSVTRQFAADYYQEPGLSAADLEAMQLEDTVLPDGLTIEEVREACRSLKGSILRQEIYAHDGSEAQARPYSVSERNYTIQRLQEKRTNRHAVFFTHPRETIDFHYERKLYKVTGSRLDESGSPACDPRVRHVMTLEVDDCGNVMRSAAIAYGRRFRDMTLESRDREKQLKTWITFTQNRYTNNVPRDDDAYSDDYRVKLLCEASTFELHNVRPGTKPRVTNLFGFDEMAGLIDASARHELQYEDVEGYDIAGTAARRRLIECLRTQYRADRVGPLLGRGTLESKALPGETYRLAFTPGLLRHVYRRDGTDLLPDPAAVLRGYGTDRGGYVEDALEEGGPVHWWIPSGRVFYCPDPDDDELAFAGEHFYLPHRFRDPFMQNTLVRYDDYKLLPLETEDAVHNKVTSGERGSRGGIVNGNDYRVLRPALVTDPNGCQVAAKFDALGMVVATAMRDGGDELEGFLEDPPLDLIKAFTEVPHAHAATLLGNATTRIVYDVLCYDREPVLEDKPPVLAATLSRETHLADPGGETSDIRIVFSYSDGFGREVQKKVPAELGPVPKRDFATGEILLKPDGTPEMTAQDAFPRWAASGWVITSNKLDKPVRQYEPFFTDVHQFEFEASIGVSPILFYDPVGRVVATLYPNHVAEKVVFDPWRQETWDVHDLASTDLQRDPQLKAFLLNPDGALRLPVDAYLPSWHALRTDPAYVVEASRRWPDLNLRDAQTRAAERTFKHRETPAITHFDSLGRSILSITDNGEDADRNPQLYEMRANYDVKGRTLLVVDPLDRIAMDHRKLSGSGGYLSGYSVDGNQVYQASHDSGERWILKDVMGKLLRRWDGRGHEFIHKYDALRRPTEIWVVGGDGEIPLEHMYERIVYGEDIAEFVDTERKLRGRPFEHFDAAGKVRFEEYDFKGNLLRNSRQLAVDYQGVPDWNIETPALLLERESFIAATRYDALDRPIQVVGPYSNRSGQVTPVSMNVIRPRYNEAGLLEELHIWLEQSHEPGVRELLDPATASAHGIARIDYNAKGQHLRVDYKNGTSTTYEYEGDSSRLINVVTERRGFPSDRRIVQDLAYAYDPSGNITSILDRSQDRVVHDNACVDASLEYEYDASYRLVRAKGREHKGQDIQVDWDDTPRAGSLIPSDCSALRNYIETFRYDAVGNILQMQHHRGSNLRSPGSVIWNRRYQYHRDSNHLLSTSRPGDSIVDEYGTSTSPHYSDRYDYDAHGNMIHMPHLKQAVSGSRPQNLFWNFRDQLQRAEPGGTGAVWYVYDFSGRRVRRVWEKQPGLAEERIYLGGFEIYRSRAGAGGPVELERETQHVMGDQRRFMLIETRTVDVNNTDRASRQLARYQLNDHLGSSIVELDEQAKVITYEQFHPYGSVAYKAGRNQTETAKRYRYTGKERDEATGLSDHGARLYAAWLGRWISCDPLGTRDGTCLYCFARDNPTNSVDLTGRQAGPWDPFIRMRRFQDAVNETLSPAVKAANAIVDQAVQGEFYEGETTWGGVAANVVAGVVPGVGQAADARDTVAAVKRVGEQPTSWGAWGGLGLAVFAWVPLAGELVKGGSKVGEKAAVEVGEELLEQATRHEGTSVLEEVVSAGTRQGDEALSSVPTGELDDWADEVMQSFENGNFSSGELLELQPHRAASEVREAIGVTGATHQSAHFGAQAALKGQAGYNAKDVLTRILPSDVHRRMDDYWKRVFQARAAAGETSTTAHDLYTTISEGIWKSPDFSDAEKFSMEAQLADELFMQLGLDPNDLLRLPYSQ